MVIDKPTLQYEDRRHSSPGISQFKLWSERRPDASNGQFALGGWSRFDSAHDPERDPDRRREPHRSNCWLTYLGDVRVGKIARAVGNPGAAELWTWHCGFYPGSEPGEQRNGTASSFEEARAQFERAWMVFSANRTEADYQEWREQRDWMARKYAAIDRGEKVPIR